MQAPSCSDSEKLWGQFFYKIHELAEELRAKKRAGQVERVSEAQTTRPTDTQPMTKSPAGQGIIPFALPVGQTEQVRDEP